LAPEHLDSENPLQVHAETPEQWMLAADLWSRARKRRQRRRRRERKEHFGERASMDGFSSLVGRNAGQGAA
jgi:predicted ribosome quality control (RQC) complex YloA/Tae2 family protein